MFANPIDSTNECLQLAARTPAQILSSMKSKTQKRKKRSGEKATTTTHEYGHDPLRTITQAPYSSSSSPMIYFSSLSPLFLSSYSSSWSWSSHSTTILFGSQEPNPLSVKKKKVRGGGGEGGVGGKKTKKRKRSRRKRRPNVESNNREWSS